MRRIFLLGVVAVVALSLTGSAAAASVPSWTYDCASDLNPAVCERLTYIASEASAVDDATTLTWWAGWAAVGLLLVLIAAPMWVSSFRFLRE